MPAVDVVESENGYEITADLPGMDEKNIEVKVTDGVLTMKDERQEEKEEKKKDYYLQERSFGSFQRSFELPETVDADKIEASFKKGVLTVKLPKKPEAFPEYPGFFLSAAQPRDCYLVLDDLQSGHYHVRISYFVRI